MSYNKSLFKQMVEESKKKKSLPKPKDKILDPMGQWAHPGQVTRIPSNRITMQGVSYPVLGVSNNGQQQMMYPGQEYSFPGSQYVDEYPLVKAQKGLTFLEPNSQKLPVNNNRSELATSIGGENGEPAFLVPSFKYGRPILGPSNNLYDEFYRTGEHLGGPFKTWQEADEWDRNVRHPYVEKGQSIPIPIRRWGRDYNNQSSGERNSFFFKNGGDVSIPNLEEGGWLDRYNVGGSTTTETTRPPIYVDNPNHPGLKAYNDSLKSYNSTKIYENKFPIVSNEVSDKITGLATTPNQFGLIPIGWYKKPDVIGPSFSPAYKKPVQPYIFSKEKPQLKMVGQDRVQSSVPSFNFGQPRLSTIEKPKGNYVLRYVEYDENGTPIPKEMFHNDRSVLDQMMGELVKDPSKTGNWSTQGNYNLAPYEDGGELPKAQIGLDNTYLPKPRVNFNYTQGKTYKQLQAEDFQRNLEKSQASRNRVEINKQKLKTPKQTAAAQKTVEHLNRESGYNTPIGNFQEAHATTLNRIQDRLSQNAEVAGLVSLGYPFISRGMRGISRLLPEGTAGQFPKQVIGKGRTIQTIREIPNWTGGVDRVNNPGFDPERYVNTVKEGYVPPTTDPKLMARLKPRPFPVYSQGQLNLNEAARIGQYGNKGFPFGTKRDLYPNSNLLGGKFPGFNLPGYVDNMSLDLQMFQKLPFQDKPINVSWIDNFDELAPYKGNKVFQNLNPNKYGGEHLKSFNVGGEYEDGGILPKFQTAGQNDFFNRMMKRASGQQFANPQNRSDISQRGSQNLKTEIATQRTKEKKAQEARTRTTIGEDTRTAKQKEEDRQAYESKLKYEKEVLGKDFETPQYLQDKNRARAKHLIHLADVGTMGAGLTTGLFKGALKGAPKLSQPRSISFSKKLSNIDDYPELSKFSRYPEVTSKNIDQLSSDYAQHLRDYVETPIFKKRVEKSFPNIPFEEYKKRYLGQLQIKPRMANPALREYNETNVLGFFKVSPDPKITPDETVIYPGTSASTLYHEMSHQVKRADELLPDWLKNQTRKNIKRDALIDDAEYMSLPDEFDARLQVLRRDLKDLGIHDYTKGTIPEEKFYNFYDFQRKNKRYISDDGNELLQSYRPEFIYKGLKYLPATIPIGIGAGALQQKKQGGQLPRFQNRGEIPWWMKRRSDISQTVKSNAQTQREIEGAARLKYKREQEARNRMSIGADTRTPQQKAKDQQAYKNRVKYEKEVEGKNFTLPTSLQERNRNQAGHIIHNLVDVPLTVMGAGELAYGVGKFAAKQLPKVGEYLTTKNPFKKPSIESKELAMKEGEDWVNNWFRNKETQQRISNIDGEGLFRADRELNPYHGTLFETAEEVPRFTTKPAELGHYGNRSLMDRLFGQLNLGFSKHGKAWVNPNQSLKNITGTTVEELTHAKTYGRLNPQMGSVLSKAVNPVDKNSWLSYLTNPKEVYPRIMRLRKAYGLKPGEIVSDELVEQMIKEKGRGAVEKDFIKSISDKIAFKNAFNTLPAIGGVGTFLGSSMLNNDGEIEQKKKGGQINWLDKYK
jgi:hypothetical protein